jgi:hypothetical protein
VAEFSLRSSFPNFFPFEKNFARIKMSGNLAEPIIINKEGLKIPQNNTIKCLNAMFLLKWTYHGSKINNYQYYFQPK